jgi:microcystin-dependent protein
MTLARIKTTSGWIDLSKIGPQGPKGDKGNDGAPGATVYDADQIGTLKGWTGKTIPTNWALADGTRYTQTLFPQGYTFAKAEADAGNPLWTYRTSDFTFTVPNLTDKFILAPGANLLGATGGEAAHTLLSAEAAQKAVTTGNDSPDHVHMQSQLLQMDNSYSVSMPAQTGSGQNQGVTGVNTGGANTRHQHAIAASDATTPHNNMPPWIAVAMIVKIKGPTIDPAGALAGPPGQGIPTGGTTGQVLSKKTATDYDTQWIAAGSSTPDSWHVVGAAGEPALASGFVIKTTNAPPLAFKKFPDGMVRLRGYVTYAAGDGGPVFTLPSGYRPPGTANQYQRFSVYGDQPGNIAFVRPDGVVYVSDQYPGGMEWDLSSIAFDTTP